MKETLVPENNLTAYICLYYIETGLREIIISSFESTGEPNSFKRRLPEDILDKFRTALKRERKTKWTHSILHHPIYYIDFPDLKKVIEKRDNWKDCFKEIFSSTDILKGTLTELEEIRNKIAHNRKITEKDLAIVKGAYAKLSQCLGEEKLELLVQECSSAKDLKTIFSQLLVSAQHCYNRCSEYLVVEEIELWQSICKSWWFEEDYLGYSVSGIKDFFTLMEEYMCIPRKRGKGYEIEGWVLKLNVKEKFLKAVSELEKIIGA